MIKILVPVDGSANALAAVRHAAFLFRERGVSEIVLLNVQPALEGTRACAFHSLTDLREYERRQGEAALAGACDILDDSGVRYLTLIGVGEKANAIASAAESLQCDGIVLGMSLWSQIKARFGGGLPAKLIRRTSVPVTVVKSARPADTYTDAGRKHPWLNHPHPQLVVYPHHVWNASHGAR